MRCLMLYFIIEFIHVKRLAEKIIGARFFKNIFHRMLWSSSTTNILCIAINFMLLIYKQCKEKDGNLIFHLYYGVQTETFYQLPPKLSHRFNNQFYVLFIARLISLPVITIFTERFRRKNYVFYNCIFGRAMFRVYFINYKSLYIINL